MNEAAGFSVEELAIPGVKLLTPLRLGDERGFLSEVYRRDRLASLGIDFEIVQINHTMTRAPGTVRGLHFQIPPAAQAKLVRVSRGAIYDVAVDIRKGSPTYGRHAGSILSAANWKQFFVPEGFAHGFCTLEPDTEVIYQINHTYSASHDRGISWHDPALRIDWPVKPDAAIVSAKDAGLPRLAETDTMFSYNG